MSHTERDDGGRLRARILAGEPAAFAELYEEHARTVHRYALRLTGDWSAAEEVMSDTFLAAWRGREGLDPAAGPLLPWLLGIATHKARNANRGLRRRLAFLSRQPPPPDVADFAAETAGRLDDARTLAAVPRALTRLRPAEREVLVLCVWTGLDYRQAAEALGVPVGTVRSRLSRARARLRGLAEEPPEPRPARGEDTGRTATAALSVREEPA
ncbi:RNA polymerase sigma factor [Streptomyces sp. ODS05-4]|uniref:RNA polymerase sigma factor n=1 Tax=Streptomyces sp. ODS05-4 TaxID=2944939 RepID=UPI00210AC856|nr:RNA polymerase sigma factor [Streptomyces sp. ODS05-4]